MVSRVTRAYREAMTTFSGMTNLDVWYARLDVEKVFAEYRSRATPAEIKRFEKNLAKAQGKDNMKAFTKLTELVDGEHRIKADPPVVVPLTDLFVGDDLEELRMWLEDRIRVYRRTLQPDRRHLLESYRLVDFARKVVGVGSVGTRCWIALMLGRDDADPLFLQVKEAEASVLEPYAGRSGFANHGQRVVEGQRLLQAASDILLGWIRTTGIDGVERDYYLRQLWDGKFSAEIEACRRRRSTSTPACADGRSRGVTPVPAIASRSPPTWGPTTRSNGRWSSSAPRTPTRTSATTRRSRARSRPARRPRRRPQKRRPREAEGPGHSTSRSPPT